MSSIEGKSNETHTQLIGPTGHPLPRRSSPANSVTLRHHRLARDASIKASPGSAPTRDTAVTSTPRRNSSGDSHETGQSDPKTWFDQSNQNPTATFDNSVMEVDPPFFQKESDSSNEDRPLAFGSHLGPPQRMTAQSSSADDYRSVIDDLTIEIQRLKEELKRYKQPGPDMLKKEKLFEIKVHGLPKKKKRELEATLRDFAASLGGSPDASSQKKKKSSRQTARDHAYSGSGSLSKHASSSSGSNFRPADSAYASMSIGAKSSGTSLNRPMMNSKDSNEKKVENYLKDIPEGLYPRHMIMTDKERKKLVVRRLEQLFTGKIGGRQIQNTAVRDGKMSQALAIGDSRPTSAPTMQQQASIDSHEPSRQAKILVTEQQSGASGKKSRSRDNGSASNSHGDGTESGGNGNSSGSGGTNPSPPMPSAPEQRPTRPRDLDPDRVQVPSENMDYIRHLGLIPPELLGQRGGPVEDVHPDAEGWVYLNLLCSLAQLHMINVTPDFVRSAVSGISTKFQLSPDGRKIRWRGGTEGTKFSSDSSGYNSQKSPSTDDSDNPNIKSNKRQKTGRTTGDDFQSGSSSKNASKFGQVPASSESFHYKPMFAQRESSGGQTSVDDTLSSFGPPEDSNLGGSRWDMSGSGTSNRKKRRHDGAIIYYSGAPFCTDLSGDPGDVSPPSHMLAQNQTPRDSQPMVVLPRSSPKRTSSGTLLDHRPLGDGHILQPISAMDVDNDDLAPSLTADDLDNLSDIELDLTWSNEDQYLELHPLEPCGLGGVLPEDHFVVVVTTKRPKDDIFPLSKSFHRSKPDDATDAIISRLATMSTSSPDLRAARPLPHTKSHSIEIEYISGAIKRLNPVPLPPPVIFFPPFSTDDSNTGDLFASEDMLDTESSEELMSRCANPHQSDDYPDGVDLSSGDEDGEEPDDSPGDQNMYDVEADGNSQALPSRSRASPPPRRTSSAAAAAGTAGGESKSTASEAMPPADGSSVATAGGVESGYTSSEEESG